MISDLKCGNSREKHYDVSVILLTYEQTKEKILLTLASIVDQKNVELQIVISDDGSSIMYVQECMDYFERCAFKDYKILCHDVNQGTVRNFDDALSVADGEYIKAIGPGDCFFSEDSLYLWLSDIKNKKGQLSFCDAVYYRWNGNDFECVTEVAHPQNPGVYRKRKSLQKKYCLLYNDIFLGATILIERELVVKYIQMMLGKIKYAEDNIYRLMVLDGVKCIYFPCYAVYYEWGTGISTQENGAFRRALNDDWNATSKCVIENCKNSIVDKKIKFFYKQKEEKLPLKGKMYAYLAYLDLFFYRKKAGSEKRLTANQNVSYLREMSKNISY